MRTILLILVALSLGCNKDVPRPVPVPLPPEPIVCPEADRVSDVEKQLAELRAAFEEFKAQKITDGKGSNGSKPAPAPAPAPVVKKPYNLPSNISPNYKPRWRSNDGLSLREHARRHHHINTDGLTDGEVAWLRDHDHDKHGGGHSHIRR